MTNQPNNEPTEPDPEITPEEVAAGIREVHIQRSLKAIRRGRTLDIPRDVLDEFRHLVGDGVALIESDQVSD